MKMIYNYRTAKFRGILTQILCISGSIYKFQFDLEKFISKKCKYIFFSYKFVHLGLKCVLTMVGILTFMSRINFVLS